MPRPPADAGPGPSVVLYFWEGCPSHPQALDELVGEMRQLGLDPERVEVREVASDAEAEAARFTGSPTIRINGEDVVDPGDAPFSLTCRIYRLRDGRISAIPDRADVRDALAGGIDKQSQE